MKSEADRHQLTIRYQSKRIITHTPYFAIKSVQAVHFVRITGIRTFLVMDKLFVRIHGSLPIFKVDHGSAMILYTPGYSLKINSIPVLELQRIVKDPSEIRDQMLREALLELLDQAQIATEKWEMRTEAIFTPECLTIHAGSECNLNCSYCYSKSEKLGNLNIKGFPDTGAIRLLFNETARTARKGSGLATIVFHGSGEPTYHWKKLVAAVLDIKVMAESAEINTFFYIATNGCLTRTQIDWLAMNMDLIGISCDGPASIQKRQRTPVSNKYLPIEEVCCRILEKGGRFDARVTVTRDTYLLLPEITTYLIEHCKAKNIRIEPVYQAGDLGFKKEDAEDFFKSFAKARNIAGMNGISLDYSGVRMSELHGPFCDVLRNNIRLTADGLIRNCFCFMKFSPGFIIGSISPDQTDFSWAVDIGNMKQCASGIPEPCYGCINIYHCSRGCPDFCISELADPVFRELVPFRCRLHQMIAVEKIMHAAGNMNLYELARIA